MADLSIDIKAIGRLFSGATAEDIKAGTNEGINLIALQGEAYVKEQLVPGHGVVTGHLRASIHGGLVRDLHGQVDAGAFQQGANVNYVDAVEFGTRPHVIVPVRAKVLAFKVGGRTVFARRVNHPGSKGLGMFANAYKRLQGLDLNKFIGEKIAARLNR